VAVGPALTIAIAFMIEVITKKRNISHDVLYTISRFSGLGLLVYAYIKFWDLAAVSYYGRTPAVSNALAMLGEQTPYNFGFWFGEILIGILIPVLIFLLPSLNRKPANLIFGAACAMLGVIANRWNITVSGLFVPVSYSPGTLFHLPPGQYFPSLVEWAVVLGIVGYVLLMLTLGILYLPLFPKAK